jgi:hypothetical protein
MVPHPSRRLREIDKIPTYLAEGDFIMHLSADVVYIVVDHRQRHADRENCDNGESDCRIGHEPISLDPMLFHGGALGFVLLPQVNWRVETNTDFLGWP